MVHEDFLKRCVRYYPDKLAVIDGDIRFSYSDFYQRTNRLANALLGLGVEKGSRVAIMERNSYQYLELFYAVAKIGAVLVLVNWRLKGKELFYILNNSEARSIVFGEEFYPILQEIQPELPQLKNHIVIGKKLEGTEQYDMLVENPVDTPPSLKTQKDDVVLHMYTSGTTGNPKGTLLSHQCVLTTQFGQMLEIKPFSQDVHLHCGAFFHMPLLFELGLMMFGVTIVIIRQFEARETLRLIQDEKITGLFLIPTMLHAILDLASKESFDLTSLKHIAYGGMPISLKLLERAMKLVPVDFFQFYGSTEAGNISILLPEDHLSNDALDKNKRLRSAGRCDLFTELKLVDEEDREVPVGQSGEIVVKSDSVARAYWKLPELNEKHMKDEWFHTGDIGRLDAEGYLYIVDRKNEMIISGGENIYPAEIEQVITSHPAVQHAAVIGIPDKQWGESVKAFVMLNEGHTVTEEEIILFCKERLAGYKKPKSVDFVDSLPMSPAGKILKKTLREKYWQGYERRVG